MKPNHKIYQQFLKLRILIGYLGEKRQCNWWDTGFLDTTGRRFLESTFPRTSLAAALRSTSEAARMVHDAHIGKKGAYHLFRLPVEQEDFLEAHIHNFMENYSNSLLSSKEAALEELSHIASGGTSKADGPIQIGTASAIFKESSFAKLAAYYHEAFTGNFHCFPYFVTDQK